MNTYTFRSNDPNKSPIQVEAGHEYAARRLAMEQFHGTPINPDTGKPWYGDGLHLIASTETLPDNTITTPRGAFPR